MTTMEASSSAKTVFHLGALAILSYSFLLTSDESYAFNLAFVHFGGRANFLTIWGLVLSIVAFTANVLVDLFPNAPFLLDFKKISSVVAFSVESLITTLYWPMIFFNPELMASSDFQLELPPIGLDLAYHLYPVVLLWIDYLVFSGSSKHSSRTVVRLSNGRQMKSWVLLLLTTVAYVSRIEFTHFQSDVPLPYPFLQLASIAIRALIYLVAASVSYFYLIMGEKLHHVIS